MLRHAIVFVFAAACGGSIATSSDSGAPADAAANDASTSDGSVGSCASGCGPAQYCKLDRTCGSTAGACAPRPTACPKIYAPVCGADGTVYGNECAANAAGVDITDKPICKPPQGMMSCGSGFCDAGSAYCQTTGNDAIGPGTPCASFVCQKLPASCVGKSDCSCFPVTTPCGQQCKFDGNGFVITCLGG